MIPMMRRNTNMMKKREYAPHRYIIDVKYIRGCRFMVKAVTANEACEILKKRVRDMAVQPDIMKRVERSDLNIVIMSTTDHIVKVSRGRKTWD